MGHDQLVQHMGSWAESVGVNPGSACYLLCNLGFFEPLCHHLLLCIVGTRRTPSPGCPKDKGVTVCKSLAWSGTPEGWWGSDLPFRSSTQAGWSETQPGDRVPGLWQSGSSFRRGALGDPGPLSSFGGGVCVWSGMSLPASPL